MAVQAMAESEQCACLCVRLSQPAEILFGLHRNIFALCFAAIRQSNAVNNNSRELLCSKAHSLWSSVIEGQGNNGGGKAKCKTMICLFGGGLKSNYCLP